MILFMLSQHIQRDATAFGAKSCFYRVLSRSKMLAGLPKEQDELAKPAEASNGSKASLTGIDTIPPEEPGASASSIAASSPPSPPEVEPSQGAKKKGLQSKKTSQRKKRRAREVSPILDHEPGNKRQQAKASTASTASPGLKRLSKGIPPPASNTRSRKTPGELTPSTVTIDPAVAPVAEEQVSQANGTGRVFAQPS